MIAEYVRLQQIDLTKRCRKQTGHQPSEMPRALARTSLLDESLQPMIQKAFCHVELQKPEDGNGYDHNDHVQRATEGCLQRPGPDSGKQYPSEQAKYEEKHLRSSYSFTRATACSSRKIPKPGSIMRSPCTCRQAACKYPVKICSHKGTMQNCQIWTSGNDFQDRLVRIEPCARQENGIQELNHAIRCRDITTYHSGELID